MLVNELHEKSANDMASYINNRQFSKYNEIINSDLLEKMTVSEHEDWKDRVIEISKELDTIG